MMLNIFNDIGTFFKNVDWKIVGIATVVSIIVGLLLILISKRNKVVSFFSFLLVLITGISVIVISYNSNINSYGDWRNEVTIDTQLQDVENSAKDKYTNTNGGFTIPQIADAKKQIDCPTADDQILNFSLYDYGDYVLFEGIEDDRYENLIFLKTDKGLIADGFIGYMGHFTKKINKFLWFYDLDVNSYKWFQWETPNLSTESFYVYFNKYNANAFNNDAYVLSNLENYVTYTDQKGTYWYVGEDCKNRNAALNVFAQETAIKTGENIADYTNFNNIELISTKELVLTYVNSYFTYLYNETKNIENGIKLIDVSNLMCLPIPEDLRHNYPVSSEFKEKYPDKDYYGIYNCSIAVELTKHKGQDFNLKDSTQKQYENSYYNDPSHYDIEYKNNNELSLLNIKFVDTQNSTFENFDKYTNHAYLTIFDDCNKAVKTINLNSEESLNKLHKLLLNKNKTYTYEIYSGPLIFENVNGSFKMGEFSEILYIPYYYLNNYMVQSVGLNPIGTIDTTKLDLVNNPVKIILNGKTNNETYQFVFNKNEDFEKYKTMMVQMGDYTFAILSKQLIFNEVSGELTISSETPIILFNCTLQNISSDLTFTINLETYSNNKDLSLYSDASNVTLIREKLSSQKVYNVITTIYDDDGYIIEKLTHQHAVTGTCSDSWNFTNMIDGEHYTLQLSFVDAYDSTKTYLSDIFEFTYDSTKNYRVIYNVTKNA